MIHRQRDIVDRYIAQVGLAKAGSDLGVAALLYTYRCTIACWHCCFGCTTNRPDVHMGTDRAVAHLAALHETGRVIHIAGGEAMIYWDDLRRVLEKAAARGCQPHFIETNASFATSDAVVRDRFRVLRDCGVVGILTSADPYHQAFVPPENVIRVRRLAAEWFGPQNLWMTGVSDEEIRGYAATIRDETRLAEYVRAHPPVLVGNAHRELRRYLPEHPLDALPGDPGWRDPNPGPGCAVVFDRERIWELHIDPYDNIQTNCGVVLGSAARTSPLELLRRGPGTANEIVALLCREGPVGLAHLARARHGYAIPERACTKCDLCYQVRNFLRPHYPEILGPAEVYAV